MRSSLFMLLALCGILAMFEFDSDCAEIGFAEEFALAPNREDALKQLIPGTEEFYYYNCLHLQNSAQYGKVDELLKQWIQRHGENDHVREVVNRQALLQFDKDPAKTFAFLRERLHLTFNHQRHIPGQKPNYPIALDPKSISPETLNARAFSLHGDLSGFTDSALDLLWVLPQFTGPAADGNRRRMLLQRIQRPDYANLAAVIVADLKFRDSGGFGSLGIHRLLTQEQLDECAKLRPELSSDTNFVNTYLARLQPNPDVDIKRDLKERLAHLERLWAFVSKLAPSFNSLKALVLYQRLAYDQSQGIYDKDRFLEYLKLPRSVHYMRPEYLARNELKNVQADLSQSFDATKFPPIHDDEALVRDYLMHFFITEESFEPYSSWLELNWLKQLFAETKILNGIGDQVKWYALLDNPALFQQLKDRVELDFVPINKEFYAAGDPVSLSVDIKNVKMLTVKVYEINTANYYREQQREVDTSLNLDGLIANQETPYTYDEAPLRRVRRTFDFPNLKNAGVYFIDFIGNGKSSRAVIRKGRLHAVERSSAAGQLFSVFDEANAPQKSASLWFAGHEYTANKEGEIFVPFSNAPGRQMIVLASGSLLTVDTFQHQAETYALAAGIHVEREELLKRKTAQLAIRPQLSINGVPMALKALEDVTLVLHTTDREGIASMKEVRDFKLFEDRESIFEFQVPEKVAALTVTLRARIDVLSQNRKQDLADQRVFTLNEIDKTANYSDVHFSRIESGYVLTILGKNGEPLPERALNISFKSKNYNLDIHATLKSAADGRIALGQLEGIESVDTPGLDGTPHSWPILHDKHSLPLSLFGKAGDTLRVPYMGALAAPSRLEFSLLEKRGGGFLHDKFDALSLKDGLLEIAGLAEGDYDLWLKTLNRHIDIKLAAGVVAGDYAASNARMLERSDTDPLQISIVEVNADTIKITLKNAGKSARLHAAATHFQTSYQMFDDLGSLAFEEPTMQTLGFSPSHYLAGRDIGDEYRYILDRRAAPKFPGNMLNRPSLLLNPWALRKTEMTMEEGAGRGSFGSRSGGGRSLGLKRHGGSGTPESAGHDYENFDFLPAQSPLLANLRPDANGVISIARKALDSGQQLHLFAADRANSVYRQIILPEQAIQPIDLRLAKSFDPAKHFTERKQVSILEGNQSIEIADISSSSIEVYDSVSRVWTLYNALNNDAKLNEFTFITRWHLLKPDEKRELYSKNACHELSFFLMKKDPEFFKATIQPYLKNKKDKTFVDHFLLDDDLAAYLKPWAYGQLNVVERILLIQRIQGEGPAGARHVRELFELLPPDFEHFNTLYQTAIKGSELDTGDGLGVNKAREAAAANYAKMPAIASPMAPAGGNAGHAMAFAMPPADKAAALSADRDSSNQSLTKEKLQEQPPDILSGEMFRNRAESAKKLSDAKADDSPTRALRRESQKSGEAELEMRKETRQFYARLDKTEEWVEDNYYHLPNAGQNAHLVTVNAFWNDYAAYMGAGAKGAFRSEHAAEASRNFTEIMFALAVLDLPFEAQKHTSEFAGAKMTFGAKSPVLLFHKEIKESDAGEKSPILATENFFKLDDRYRFENNEKFEKYVSGEFLSHTVYGCQVILTNPTANPMKLELLMQIPEGALPVNAGFYAKGTYLNLAPYSTSSNEYFFYFPLPGTFAHYPVQVAKNEKIVAFTAPETLIVVEQLTKADTTSWDYVSQNGKPEDVVAFLNANNIERLNLDLLAWRMKDAAFFTQITALLAQRHVYHQTLWSYALKVGDVDGTREFLQHDDSFDAQVGPLLESKLLSIDPVVRKLYEHMEYSPLVNARAHRFGKSRKVLNDAFSEQYQRLLHVLAYKAKLDATDLMAVTYYLLLQDRVEEGLAAFAKVDPNALTTRLQHDFFQCYADFYAGDTKAARGIADRYTDYPVTRWRNTFAEVRAQCDEVDGKGLLVIDKDDKRQKQGALADTEPAFDFKVEAQKISIEYKNLTECRVDYYLMDIELLFSGNPFVQEYTGQFAYIRPNKSDVVKLPAGGAFALDLPKEFQSSNVMVEISAAGQKHAHAYYANSLAVQVTENYGQLRVTQQNGGKPVAKAYVKVYARNKSGAVAFYKDGYTDLRGKLDYASLSTNELENVQKFSILVMSENEGALVREALPPKQ